MKKLFIMVIATLAIIALAEITVKAQEMKKPETPDAVKNLMKFIGKWQSNYKMTYQGKTSDMTYHNSCKKVAEGYGIYFEESFGNKEMGIIKASDLVGYNPNDKKIHWYMVESMTGTAMEYIGEWDSPDHLVVEYNGPFMGMNYNEKLEFTFKGKDEGKFKIVGTSDGKEITSGEGMFYRENSGMKKEMSKK
jgi:hypothetical protein